MNIEALTHDINTALDRHGISGKVQTTLAGLLLMTASPAGRSLIEKFLDGATLFAVDDSSHTALSRSGSLPANAELLNRLLCAVTPRQLRDLLTVVLAEVRDAQSGCNCRRCVARRAEPSNPMQPKDKGRLEAAFINAEDANCRSKH